MTGSSGDIAQDKKTKVSRSERSIALPLVWAIVGFLLAHLLGLSYIAAARYSNEAAFVTYHKTMEEELMEMPPAIQLVASYASHRALEAAVRENRRRPWWVWLFWSPPEGWDLPRGDGRGVPYKK